MAKKKSNKEVYVTPEVEIISDEETEVVSTETSEEDNVTVLPVTCRGMVQNCKSLNIRQEPNIKAKVIGVVFKGDFLLIDHDRDTEDFYGIKSPNGAEGYCMKAYIGIIDE